MEDARWRLSGAVAGILFVVFLALTVALGTKPVSDKSVAHVVRTYSHHSHRTQAAAMFGALAAFMFLWFLAHLRRLLVGRSPLFDRLAGGLMASGTAVAAIGAFNAIFAVALELAVSRPGVRPDDSLVLMLNDLNNLFTGPLAILISLFMLGFGLALMHRAFAAAWLAVPAFIAAALSIIGGIANFYPSVDGKLNGITVLGFIGLLLSLLTILVTSILLATESAPTEALAAT